MQQRQREWRVSFCIIWLLLEQTSLGAAGCEDRDQATQAQCRHNGCEAVKSHDGCSFSVRRLDLPGFNVTIRRGSAGWQETCAFREVTYAILVPDKMSLVVSTRNQVVCVLLDAVPA